MTAGDLVKIKKNTIHPAVWAKRKEIGLAIEVIENTYGKWAVVHWCSSTEKISVEWLERLDEK